jgi:hypothetical protein
LKNEKAPASQRRRVLFLFVGPFVGQNFSALNLSDILVKPPTALMMRGTKSSFFPNYGV